MLQYLVRDGWRVLISLVVVELQVLSLGLFVREPVIATLSVLGSLAWRRVTSLSIARLVSA